MAIRKDIIQLEVEINGKKAGKTYKDLVNQSRNLKRELYNLTPGTDAFIKKSAELQKVNKRLADIRKQTRGVNRSMEMLKSTMVGVVGAFGIQEAARLFVRGMAAMVGAASNFEKAMSEVGAVSDYTAEQMGVLQGIAKDLGSRTSKTATEAAQGIKFLALAGFEAGDAMEAIEPVLRLSEAAGIDLATASDLATDAMSALGLGASDLEGFLDIVANASTKSNTSIEQLNQAFISAGGQFKNFNVPLEEANALLGVMANRGIKGAEAGNSMNSILINMTSGAGKAGKAMEELNISAFDSEGNFRGVSTVLKDLNAKFSTMTQEQANTYKAMIAGKFQITGFNALLSGMSEEFDGLNMKLGDSSGKLNEVSKELLNNFQGTVTKAKSAIEALAIQIGERLLPFLTKVVAGFTTFIQAIAAIPSFIKENRTSLKLLVAGLILFNSQMILAAANSLRLAAAEKARIIITKGVAIAQRLLNAAMTANPIGLVIKAIALLVAGMGFLYNRSEIVREIVDKLGEAFKSIVPLLAGVKQALIEIFKRIVAYYTTQFNVLKIAFLSTQKALTLDRSKKKELQDRINELKSLTKDAWNTGRTIGEAFREGYDEAVLKKSKSDSPSTISTNATIPGVPEAPAGGDGGSASGGGSSQQAARQQLATGTLTTGIGSVNSDLSDKSFDRNVPERLQYIENALDQELDLHEKAFLTKMFTEEEYRMAQLESEQGFWEKKLAIMREQGLQQRSEFRKAELELLKVQDKMSQERIALAEREAQVKRSLEESRIGLAKTALDAGIELLSEDEQARKKHASAIKAFQIAQVTIDGIREVQAIWAKWGGVPGGQVIGSLQTAGAAIRTGVAIAKISKQKFNTGGFTGPGSYRDETGQRVAGIVHQDEYVAPTDQIQKYPALFSFLNQDRMRKFNTGGFTSVDTTPSQAAIENAAQGPSQDNSRMIAAMEAHTRALMNPAPVKSYVVHTDIKEKDREIEFLESRAGF